MKTCIGKRGRGVVSVRLRWEKEAIIGKSELGIPRDRETRIGVLVERVELVVEHQLGDYVAAIVQMNDALVECRETDERLGRGIGENLDRIAGEVLALVYGHVYFVLD